MNSACRPFSLFLKPQTPNLKPEQAGERVGRLRALLAAYGIRPRRGWGQNFLLDPNFAAAIARTATPDEKTLLIEVGPGTGTLTRALLAAHPRALVLAIELDRRLVGLLRAEFAADLAAGRLTLLQGDALASKHELNPELECAIERLARAEDRPRRVLCANLPYNIATPLVANLAEWGAPAAGGRRLEAGGTARAGAGQDVPSLVHSPRSPVPAVERAVATVQLEVAERLVARPGTPEYGPLSVFLALRGARRILRRVGAEVFWPRPRVSSAVVELTWPKWAATPFRPGEAAGFKAFVAALFQHRRKTLRALLKGRLPAGHPAASRRAEALPPDELLDLYRETGAPQPTAC
jgi:16S rRNA (adenine1518-N6/adenine1519-N6)-dimethyltransferase